ncbi:eukaryotic translation initiation factor 3 subunit A [Anabrus simplex]|uniref:eukaryotic translation initiation factor 3 subunit A n=1 Tax=Anabrus simplex TaxID=316456 RepID=UPI0035A3653D
MARYGQRPENALKRANEFIEVGKPARALDTLYEVFRNKKWAYSWSESVLEPIMFKYLDLCVELKKSHIAKEGLFQYRNMFQSVNVSSLENVIRGYLRTAEERTESAREQSQQAVIDIDDLDMLATPESILLSAVSGEDAQDRSDRTILTPWVKFLWESYCQCLELLRTNAHVETLYHDIARMAFSFCLKYNRKTEFRKLCDKLRKHLEDISKLPAQTVNVSIQKPETQQLNLDTRLVQLDSAIQMELWQEAYKAIEDIHGLMNLSKKLPVPKTMANYYQKLAMVFWKAGNYLFHAAAHFKLFQLSKEMKKNITPEDLQRMACRVLLATLSIPLPSAHPEFDRFIETDKSPLEKAQRLAILLGLPQPPTRASLLKDIVRMNVVALASPQLQDLYNWLEVEFHPLLLCSRVHSVIEQLQADEGSPLQQYVDALQDVTLVRLIRQVSQVYQTIEFTRLLELAKFATPFHLERLLVDCVRHNDMQIRIDHGSLCIHFGMDLSESQREDVPEGPTLQSMPSEQVRNQLVNMATVLHRALAIINPHKKRMEREKLRMQMVQHYNETKQHEHQRILARHKIIEDRKEYLERLNTAREEEEARRQEELARQQMLAEQKRLEQEREERERKRQENEIQMIRDRHRKEKMQQISQTSHGQKVLKKLDEDDIKKLDADQIAAKEQEELQKERRELQQKLKSQEKKVDYFERAKRLEEIPLLQKAFEDKQIQDRKFWEQQENERIQQLVEERELAVQHRERLKRMIPDKEAFLEKLKSERKTVYLEKLKEFEKMVEEERKKLLAERKQRRKEERRAKWLKEREEEEKWKREEEARRVEEEARRKLEEEEAQKKLRLQQEQEEYRRQKEILDRQAKLQRQREQEAEERRREQEREEKMSWRRPGPGPRPPTQLRDREPDREKEDFRSKTTDASDWRRSRPRSPADGPKPDIWRRSEVSERPVEREREREPERERGFDRDKDRDDRPSERDRGGFDRDRDRGFGGRMGGGFDRGGGGSGSGGFERSRGGFDRDRERPPADRGSGGGGGFGMSSWRSKPAESDPVDEDSRATPRRDDRRAPPLSRGGNDDRPTGAVDWRSREPAERRTGDSGSMRRPGPDDRRRMDDRGRGEPPRDAPREGRPNDPPAGSDSDDIWQRVKRR